MLPYCTYESYSSGIVFSSEVTDPNEESYKNQGRQAADATGRANASIQNTGWKSFRCRLHMIGTRSFMFRWCINAGFSVSGCVHEYFVGRGAVLWCKLPSPVKILMMLSIKAGLRPFIQKKKQELHTIQETGMEQDGLAGEKQHTWQIENTSS
jgi:hypothetical protein